MGIFERLGWKHERPEPTPEKPPIHEIESRTAEKLPLIFNGIDMNVRDLEQVNNPNQEIGAWRDLGTKYFSRIQDAIARTGLTSQQYDLTHMTPLQTDTLLLAKQLHGDLQTSFDRDGVATGREVLAALRPLNDTIEAWQDEHGIERLARIGQTFQGRVHDIATNAIELPAAEWQQLREQYDNTDPSADQRGMVTRIFKQGYLIPYGEDESHISRAHVEVSTPQ